MAASTRTGRSTAVLASQAVGRVVRMGVPVVDRAVVDRTFATRDLVRALHRTPRHLVLVLENHRARLLDGAGDAADLLPPAASRWRAASTWAGAVRRRTGTPSSTWSTAASACSAPCTPAR